MKKFQKALLFITIIGLIAASAGAYYFYDKYQEVQNKLDNPENVAQEEVANITNKLGKLMILPEDEEPTVATVLEKDKIQDQPFFSKAENGDKVIIYTKAMKAILYRPSANKIIEVAPISITQPEGSEANGAMQVKNDQAADENTAAPTKLDNEEKSDDAAANEDEAAPVVKEQSLYSDKHFHLVVYHSNHSAS